MKRKLSRSFTFILFLSFSNFVHSQSAIACINAAVLCGGTSNNSFVLVVGGTGLTGLASGPSISNPAINPQIGNGNSSSGPSNSGCDFANAPGPTWLTFKIIQSGNLEFNFGVGGNPQLCYYDWMLWKIDTNITKSCNQLFNGNLAPVSCNWNCSSSGGTGMGPAPISASVCNFQPSIFVNSGDQFLLLFSNYCGNNGNVVFTSTGSAIVGCSFALSLPAPQTICQNQTAIITPTFAFGVNPTYTLVPGYIVSNTSFTLNPTSSTVYTILASSTNTANATTFTGQANYSLTVNLCTNISKKYENTSNIFPNPFSNELKIGLDNYLGSFEVSVFNVTGEEILSLKGEGEYVTLNTSEIKQGIYFIKVVTSEKTILYKGIKD